MHKPIIKNFKDSKGYPSFKDIIVCRFSWYVIDN